MIDDYTKCARPLRDVDVEYTINQSKCDKCKDKPCLEACPIDAIFLDDENHTKINPTCFGCVLCRNACPYDAIKIESHFAPPIKENVPNINKKLCKACGACVRACKTGAIHLKSTGSSQAHSEIDKDKCVRCGYCFRVCPTDAIKYGELIPKTVKGGKAIVINQDICIGCMTCTRVCPSVGAINVGRENKLPYINPAYCARCEECMHSCPSTAIKYSSRKKAYATYSKLKSKDIVSEIVDKDMIKLAFTILRAKNVLLKISRSLSLEFDDDPIKEYMEVKVNDLIEKELGLHLYSSIKVSKITDLFDSYLINRNIKVHEKLCIGCGECINACPVNAIYLEVPSPIHITDDCVYCGKCVNACRFDSIELYDDFFYSSGDDFYYARSFIKDEREGDFTISSKKCQACGICVNNCPTNVLTLENNEILFDEEGCIYCRQCEAICPVDSIKIYVR